MFPRVIGLIVFCVCTNFVSAKPLHIEISGGQNIGIPIAVLPFVAKSSPDPIERAVDTEDLAQVINNDLHNSGHFRTLEVKDVEQSEDNSGYWKNFGAANLIVGEVIANGNGLYDVTVKVIDVYKGSLHPILYKRFRDKYPSEFRALAHHISDLVFEKITGIRGFFSTRIAYITVDRDDNETLHTLTVADADGFNDQPLLAANYPLMSPRWSPDGKKIAFVSFRGNRSSINVVTLESGSIDVVTKFPGINGAPAWSPDGKKLAMVLSKDGAPKIYLLNLESKELMRLTSGGAIDTEPFWHPNGSSIYFTSNRGGKPQIYRVDLLSGGIERVTFEGNYNTTPSITPDGRNLVMLHQSKKGTYNIAVQDMDTGKVKLLTRSALEDSPSVAPNGTMVLYGINGATQNVLGAVTLDGKFRMRIPVQDGNVKEPAWSPFLVQ